MTTPTGTIAEVLDWVGDDPDRADLALQAEYSGQQRSTLIAQLEATATKEATSMTDTDTEVELAPGPEAPDVCVDPDDESTTVLATVLRDSEVEVEADIPVDGVAVESLGGAVAPHGFVLVINGEAFTFTPQLTASLRMIVNAAIAGVTL